MTSMFVYTNAIVIAIGKRALTITSVTRRAVSYMEKIASSEELNVESVKDSEVQNG